MTRTHACHTRIVSTHADATHPKTRNADGAHTVLIAAGLGSKDAKAFIPRMAATVLRDPHVTAEQKTAAEKAAKDWLTAYAAKNK